MDIKITGKNINLSEKFRDVLTTKIGILERYLNRIQYIDILVEKFPSHHHDVQLKIGVPGINPIIVRESGINLHETIDLLRKKAEKVLTSQKEKFKLIKNEKPIIS